MGEKLQPDFILETTELKYSIFNKTQTASICGFTKSINHLIIPRSVKHESNEYLITSILGDSFYMMESKIIEIASDSDLHTIEMDAFRGCPVEKIILSSNVINLVDGWCHGTENLHEVQISSDNPRYKIYEDQSIIGKSSIEQDYYDIFIFSARNIKKLTIPNYIELIGPFAFEDCLHIDKIEIPADSKLQVIGSFAFTGSSITAMSIPSQLKYICNNAFSYCEDLEKFEIPIDSELQEIECNTFAKSSIERIFIPSGIIEISEKAFHNCHNLQQIEFSKNSKLQKIGRKAFFSTSLKEIIIPRSVKTIEKLAFYDCVQLERIEISENSELQYIGFEAFSNVPLNSLLIPKDTTLFDGWCINLKNLNKIKIMPNNNKYIYLDEKYIIGKSNSNEFDKLIFARRDIITAVIPSFIKRITPFSFDKCLKLKSVEFLEDSKLEIIDEFAFQYSSIKYIKIPANLTRINEGSFILCKRLKKIEMPENSELNTIETKAFSNSSIESLFFPSKLTNLEKGWCFELPKLVRIDVMINNPRYSNYDDDNFIIGKSSLSQTFYDVLVFAKRNIKKAVIPDFIKIIDPYAFDSCKKLEVVEISKNSQLESIEEGSFLLSSIKKIRLPSTLLKIGSYSFYNCKKLTKIEFSENSELQIIEKNAFRNSSINSFILPAYLTYIGEKAFDSCQNLNKFEIPINSKLERIDDSAFSFTNIRSIYFPQNLNETDMKSFVMCMELRIIEIDENSEINYELIDIRDFALTTRVIFMIPVKVICRSSLLKYKISGILAK